jgi:cell division protease FtsH
MQKNFSVETATKIDAEIRKIIDTAHAEAIRLIKENREDVELLAKTLIEHEQITAEQIDYLMEHRELPKNGNGAIAPQEEKVDVIPEPVKEPEELAPNTVEKEKTE